MVKRFFMKFYLVLIIAFLYIPIAVLVVLSFNASRSRVVWGGFTLEWYQNLLHNNDVMAALQNTLTIGFASAAIATGIGLLAAIGIDAMRKRSYTLTLGIGNIPMLNADIVTGIALMLWFSRFTNLGYVSILLAHITFNIPYVILSILPKLQQMDMSVYEAARDLGANSVTAFVRVILPMIFPSVMSGFFMALTMSMDDFVVTYFTKGAGINTLSTMIYGELKRGIKPEMYALSTIMFMTVLVLLFLINFTPKQKNSSPSAASKRRRHQSISHIIFKRAVPAAMILVIAAGGFYYGSKNGVTGGDNQLIVYNWGEYLDPDVIPMFEKETGIQVVYEEYETNEIMYPKVQSGAIAYDVVCPSDYMIQRMIENDLLAKINFDNIPNIKYIGDTYLEQSRQFDPDNLYSVPYCWGTVGILYNKTMVDEPIDSWSVLWDEKYKDNILMQDSVRDAFAVALKYIGASLNSTDLNELEEAKQLLIDQKPLVQAYVIDQVRDKMIGNEAAIGVIYSGEAIYTQAENPNLEYVIPKEGSNLWIDSWVIPKNAQHKENAEKFINFLCRPDIAKINFDYITYSTPNTGARELIEDPAIRNSKIAFPEPEDLVNCETFRFLGDKYDAIYNQLWREVKSK